MTDLMTKDKFLDVHRNMRDIYEFVMYMFILYDMPIDDLVPENDDKKLRLTMSNAIGKQTKHCHKRRDYVLTFSQYTTASRE